MHTLTRPSPTGRALRRLMYPLTPAEMGAAFRLEDALHTGTLPLVVRAEDPVQTLTAYVQNGTHFPDGSGYVTALEGSASATAATSSAWARSARSFRPSTACRRARV